MYPSYAKWVQSHRDLPIKLNQWCNVVVSLCCCYFVYNLFHVALGIQTSSAYIYDYWKAPVHTTYKILFCPKEN